MVTMVTRAGERLAQRREWRLDVVRPAIGRRVADRRVVVAGALHIRDRRVVVRREFQKSVEVAVHARSPKPAAQHAASNGVRIAAPVAGPHTPIRDGTPCRRPGQ